jgi:hypothetical protein
MSSKNYKEWTGANNFINKLWTNDRGEFHNKDGPAHIICFPDGLIYSEKFYIMVFVIGRADLLMYIIIKMV